MREGRKRVCLLLCLLMVLSTCMVYGAAKAEAAEAAGSISPMSVVTTSVSFERYQALKGKLTITASSSTIPDEMYAEVMLQKKSGSSWVNQWTSPEIVYDTSGMGSLGWVGYVNVSSSGTYRIRVYTTDVVNGITNRVGPDYSQSASL